MRSAQQASTVHGRSLPLRPVSVYVSTRPQRSVLPDIHRAGRHLKASVRAHAAAPSAPLPDSRVEPAETPELVNLPGLTEATAKGLPNSAYNASRKAQALVWAPSSSTTSSTGSDARTAVIFAHGFAQSPQNYQSLIRKLNQCGWVVIAPTTTFDSFVLPWQRVETTSFTAKLPTKLQSALVLDLLKSYQYLKASHKIDQVLLCGHSMGGASAMIAGAWLTDAVKAVGVMAPAVKQTLKSRVNPDMHFDGVRDLPSPRWYRRHASDFFEKVFLPDVDLHLIGSNQDLIVHPQEVEDCYLAALTGRGEDTTGAKPPKATAYYRIPGGGHIGFEDKVGLDISLPGILGVFQQGFFTVINILIYQNDIFNFWTLDEQYSLEKELAQDILIDSFAASLGEPTQGKGEWGISDVSAHQGSYTLTRGQGLEAREEALLEGELRKGPAEAGKPKLETGLLLAYAAVQASSSWTALHLLQDSIGQGRSLATSFSLGVIAVISAGLVWENTILAAGRFITDGGTTNLGLLQRLNNPRFLFHSFAPLLSAAGINIASQAGVSWASSLAFSGLLSLVLGATVLTSLVQNTLLLQTEPQWQNGILHFTYPPKPLDFVRIIPVAATTVFLMALGVAAAKHNASLWPFPAGAAACFALSAGIIPRRVAPMILTGNLGEVLLLAGLVAGELRQLA